VILIEVDGKEYTNFSSITVSKSIEDLNGEFEFIANVDASADPLPFSGGEKCRALIDGKPIVTGYIENIFVDYDAENHNITYSGRDKTADIGDSTIGVFDAINTDISLIDVIKKVISHLGSDIKIVDNVGGLKDFKKDEGPINTDPGENAFDFIQTLCRKRGVLLTTDGDGNLAITRNSNTKLKGALQNVLNDDVSNNILSGSLQIDLTKLYNKYEAKSQSSTNQFETVDVSTENAVDNDGIVLDDSIRKGRQFAFEVEKVTEEDEIEERAEWEKDVRISRSKVVNAKVEGHSTKFDEVYEVNKLISIKDVFLNIDSVKLIGSITYFYDSEGGNTTEIGLIHKDSFTNLIDDPTQIKPGSEDDPFAGI